MCYLKKYNIHYFWYFFLCPIKNADGVEDFFKFCIKLYIIIIMIFIIQIILKINKYFFLYQFRINNNVIKYSFDAFACDHVQHKI